VVPVLAEVMVFSVPLSLAVAPATHPPYAVYLLSIPTASVLQPSLGDPQAIPRLYVVCLLLCHLALVPLF
jgi:hypothetical protein